MKIYVIKRDDGKYHYLTPEHKTEWIDSLYYADRIPALDESDYNSIKKWADKRFPNCKLVQITVLEGDLSDHTKQVRKEVCEEIKDLAGNYFELPYCDNCGETLFASSDVVLTGSDLTEILDQIQGEDINA